MVITPNPSTPKAGEYMYGITFDLDTHILEDDCGQNRRDAYAWIERRLSEMGFEHVQYSVYVCTNQSDGIYGILKAAEALKKADWFCRSVRSIKSFRLDETSDLVRFFKE